MGSRKRAGLEPRQAGQQPHRSQLFALLRAAAISRGTKPTRDDPLVGSCTAPSSMHAGCPITNCWLPTCENGFIDG